MRRTKSASKSHSLCSNCGEFDHWTTKCPHPRHDKMKFFNHKKHLSKRQSKDTREKQSEACVVTTKDHTNSSSSDSSWDSDRDTYAFMAPSRRSHALSVNLDKHAWFVDSGATKHMTEHREWFSTFKSIPSEIWSVAIIDDWNLWVRGIGNIEFMRTIDGVHKKRLLQNALFISNLRRNSFSIGLASKVGLSFQTLGDKCALYRDLDNGPKVMEETWTGTLYKLSIKAIIPTCIPFSIHTGHPPSTILIVISTYNDQLVFWHDKTGHVNIHVIKQMSEHNSL